MHEQVLGQYDIGLVRAVAKIPTGLIHETYKVETDRGIFILQKQHEIFSSSVVQDVDAVSQYLVKKGMIAQTVVKTKDNALSIEQNGGVWRLLTYIPGEVYDVVPNAHVAHEAGNMLGTFHRALADFDYEFQHARPMHHNTKEHLRLFDEALAAFSAQESSKDISPIRANRRIVEECAELIKDMLPKFLLPKNLRKMITHGDPKITNVIFGNPSTSSEYKAVALIDIDDVGRAHSPLIELGDAFRSWCGKAEDNPHNTFHLEFFESGLRGYVAGSYHLLKEDELKLIPQAIQLITLELASRFLRDYFEDNYFGWDATRYESRKEHNLARARGQVALYQDMVTHEDELMTVVLGSIT